MINDLSTRVRSQNRATNVFELFLGLYQTIAESGFSEVVRRVFAHGGPGRYDTWRRQSHRLAVSLADVIGENPNPWIEEFPAARARLLSSLEQAHREVAALPDNQEQQVACVLIALRQLDPVIEKMLCFPPGPYTYPSPPRSDGYTLVRKPRTGFYSLYRTKEDSEAPQPLQHGEFREAVGLISTYVVPPLSGGQYFEWSISRIPEPIESVWREQAQNQYLFCRNSR